MRGRAFDIAFGVGVALKLVVKKGKLSWNVTHECNRKCGHCHVETVAHGDERNHLKWLPKNDACKVADELSRQKVTRVGISGGEPLLVPYLEELVEYASRQCGIELELATNGIFLTEEKVFRLAQHLKKAATSLDYDDLRPLSVFGRGMSQEQVVGKTISLFKQYGIPVEVKTILHRGGRAEEIIETVARKGASEIQLRQFFRTDGQVVPFTERFVTADEEFNEMADSLIGKYPNIKISKMSISDMLKYGCISFDGSFYIYGKDKRPITHGNLLKDSLDIAAIHRSL